MYHSDYFNLSEMSSLLFTGTSKLVSLCTSISCFRYSLDYDVVAFVNKVEPPFKDNVLSDFQDILMRHFDVKEEDIKLTLFSIQFQLEGVDFDLLVATNMTRGLPGTHNGNYTLLQTPDQDANTRFGFADLQGNDDFFSELYLKLDSKW